jgi:hypothetical protein
MANHLACNNPDLLRDFDDLIVPIDTGFTSAHFYKYSPGLREKWQLTGFLRVGIGVLKNCR